MGCALEYVKQTYVDENKDYFGIFYIYFYNKYLKNHKNIKNVCVVYICEVWTYVRVLVCLHGGCKLC